MAVARGRLQAGLLMTGLLLAVWGAGGWLTILIAPVLGLACAVRLRPSLKKLWPPRRWPSVSEVAAVVVGLLAAFETIALVILILRMVARLLHLDRLRFLPHEAAHGVFVLLGLLLALLPVWRWLRSADGDVRSAAPLGSLLAAQMTGAFFTCAFWITHDQLLRLDLGGLLTWQPSLWLLAAVLGLTWWRVWSSQGRLEARGLLDAGLVGALAAFVALVAGGVSILYFAPFDPAEINRSSLTIALMSMIFPMVAWAVVFLGLRGRKRQADRPWSILVTLLVLALVMPLSLLLPASLADAGFRAGALFLLGLPMTFVTCVIIGIIGFILRLISPQGAERR